MASIKDVAKDAGVSPTTVSAVVNGLDCVKPSTRDRVLQSIEKLGYTPNISARELVTQKKQNIGLITMTYERYQVQQYLSDGNTDIFYADYVFKIAKRLENTGYGLLLENFYYEPGSGKIPKIVEQKRVDGVIVLGSLYGGEFIRQLKKKLPVVVTVGCHSEWSDFVCSDYTESLALPIRYLIKKGHKRIAYASGDPQTGAYSHKLLGYRQALEEAGIPFRESYVFESKYMADEGYKIAGEIMNFPKEERPTAIMMAEDILVAGAYQYFYEQHIRIPDEISLVGYENLSFSYLLSPGLTTVDWNKDRMVEEACKIIFKKLKKKDKERRGIVIPCHIVERNSVNTLK